jgi:LuxR family transcriptional regulator
MNTCPEYILPELNLPDSVHVQFREAASHAADLGFEFCSYCVRIPFPIATPTVVMFNNHPAAWNAEYRQKNYLEIDPTIKHALRSQSPLVWSDEVFATAPDLWNDARANGLHVGWAHPARDARNMVGLLTVARSGKSLCPDEAREKQSRLAWLAQTTHLGITRHLAPHFIPAIKGTLSSREIHVLRWTAEGKTASEISEILNITERTVNFHVTRAVAKLGVANKTAAAVTAALLGLF